MSAHALIDNKNNQDSHIEGNKSAMNIRPNFYSNFKMGKLEGGYMLNYKQQYKNPLDHHFQKSVSPNANKSGSSVPKYIVGLDPNFMLTDEESR